MPRDNYTNLTIKDPKRYARIKRLMLLNTEEIQWIDWVADVLENCARREQYLKQTFPHIRFVGAVKNGCVLEDKNEKHIVNVIIDKGKVIATPHREEYVLYVCLSPRVVL
jgi:hypothetical protein